MISTIISAVVVGAIIGALARLVLPGKQNVGVLMTVLLGMRVVAVARGSFVDKPHDPAEEIDSHAGEQD